MTVSVLSSWLYKPWSLWRLQWSVGRERLPQWDGVWLRPGGKYLIQKDSLHYNHLKADAKTDLPL